MRIANMTDKEIETKYTPEEIEAIYRYKMQKYIEIHAQFRIEDFIDWHEMSEEEEEKLKLYTKEIAERYMDNYMEVSIAENTVWDDLVELYYDKFVKGE